jgi:hypothetical protein
MGVIVASVLLQALASNSSVQPVADAALRIVNEKYIVEALKVDDGGWAIRVDDTEAATTKTINLDPHVQGVAEMHIHGNRIIVKENLERNLEAIAGIDAKTGEKEFEVWGRWIALSPDKRWAALESFYPLRLIDDQVWPTVNLLDVTSPEPNEVVVFPEGGYDVSAEEERVMKWFFSSPPVWNAEATAFAVLLHHTYFDDLDASELHVIVVRSIGEQPTVEDIMIDPKVVQQTVERATGFWGLTLEIADDTLRVYYRDENNVKAPLTIVPFSWGNSGTS